MQILMDATVKASITGIFKSEKIFSCINACGKLAPENAKIGASPGVVVKEGIVPKAKSGYYNIVSE